MEQSVKQRIADIQRGNVPVGYQKTKLGIIPADWQEVCFGNILHNEVRKVTKPQTAYWRLGIRSHAKGTFREFVEDPTTVNMDELYSVQTNDLVVNITFAWEHAIAIVKEEDSGLLVSHRFPTYVFNENASADFYKYIITLKWVKEQLDLISPGGAGRNRVMNKNAFLKMPCYTLPLEEQRRIAEILGCCDRVIALKKELIAEKKKQKKALMQKLLNPDSGFRLPGFSGEWKKDVLGSFIDLISGVDFSTEDLLSDNSFTPYLTGASNIDNNTLILNRWVVDPKNIALKNDILVVCKGSGVGAMIIMPIQKAHIARQFMAIRVHPTSSNKYIYYILQNSFERIRNEAQGLIVGIDRGTILKLNVAMPDKEEQQAIADILSAADKEIDLLEQELARQEQKKKSLMQLLLTGIVRV